MNVITGLPRSGSTLLCNVLNQNRRIHASSTSILHGMLVNLVKQYSMLPETAGDLGRDRTATEQRFLTVLRSICQAWYYKKHHKVIFDKSRSWTSDIMLLRTIDPNAKIIVVLRDLREVIASIEKQHRKTSLFDKSDTLVGKSLFTRTQSLLSPQGMVGHCLVGIKDIIDRRLQNIFWLRYEDFVAHPEQMMERLYCYFEIPQRSHDFDDVKNTATDSDYIYLNKFPHKGEGKIESVKPSWMQFIHPNLAAQIIESFPWYNKAFGYELNTLKPMRLANVTTSC